MRDAMTQSAASRKVPHILATLLTMATRALIAWVGIAVWQTYCSDDNGNKLGSCVSSLKDWVSTSLT
jgi:hypothetical protein